MSVNYELGRVAQSEGGLRRRVGIRIWDTRDWQELLQIKGHTDQVWSLAFSPDGKTLSSGSWDKTLRLWRAATVAEARAPNN